jgi:hypothetical protein
LISPQAEICGDYCQLSIAFAQNPNPNLWTWPILNEPHLKILAACISQIVPKSVVVAWHKKKHLSATLKRGSLASVQVAYRYW